MRGTANALGRTPLFADPSEEQLAWISEKGTEVHLEPGTLIASQGDPADGFYVVLRGKTEWTRNVGDGEELARTTEPREVLE